MAKNILLLKNKTVPKDPYEEIFKQHNHNVVFLPLLKHSHMNHSTIINFITSNEFLYNYRAFIITSQRCIESLDVIIRKLKNEEFSELDLILNKPSYTVGPATYDVLSKLGFTDIRGGEEAGNGSILSDMIIHDELFNCEDEEKKVLFLTGEIRKDIIPRKLKSQNFQFKELVSYRTEPLDDIVDRYLEINQNFFTMNKENGNENWIIFFSPQGTEKIVTHIKENKECNLKIGSIGPTTEEYLLGNGLKPRVVSKKPNASSLLESIMTM